MDNNLQAFINMYCRFPLLNSLYIIFFISLSLKIHILHILGLRQYDIQKPID